MFWRLVGGGALGPEAKISSSRSVKELDVRGRVF